MSYWRWRILKAKRRFLLNFQKFQIPYSLQRLINFFKKKLVSYPFFSIIKIGIQKIINKRQFAFKKIWKQIIGQTIYRRFVLIYFLCVFIGAILLYAPFSLNHGWTYDHHHYVYHNQSSKEKTYNFFDALFFAFSAFSNTGLVPQPTGMVFNFVGQLVLAVLIQLGGFGLLASIVLLWQILIKRNKLTFGQHRLLHFERGNDKIGQSYKVIYFAFLVFGVIQLVGWFLLTTFFYFVSPNNYQNPANNHGYNQNSYYHNFWQSLWAGLFHVISATNNAGFDLLGENSIQPYNTGIGNILSVIILVCLVFGGVGYPVFYDLFSWIKAKRKQSVYQITLFTKLSLVSYFVIALLGAVLILLFELPPRIGTTTWFYHPQTQGSSADKVWNFIFITFSARSAGFAPLKINDLTLQSQWLIAILMFIGASPASTGGGIRTITLALIVLYLFNYVLGRKTVLVFKRAIRSKQINESFLTFTLAAGLVVIISFLLSISLDQLPAGQQPITSLFEAISAFGTSGLSNGATAHLGYLGRIGLIFLMFIGQLGISGTLLSLNKQKPMGPGFRYKYEELKVT